MENLEIAYQKLSTLPERVDRLEGQFLQLRAEMKAEFSATRLEFKTEMRALETRLEDRLGTQMRVLYEDLVERIKKLGDGSRRRRP